jgi:predicted nucleic acid-binding protein
LSVIYWDTNLFMYLLEEDPNFFKIVERLLVKMNERGDSLCTSVFTRGEVLIGPEKRGTPELSRRIRDYLQPPEVDILPFTEDTADYYARIRANNKVSPADAIHLASAAAAGVDLFLTNDRALQRMIVPGIQFVGGMDVDLF